jgi:hypothetical protein
MRDKNEELCAGRCGFGFGRLFLSGSWRSRLATLGGLAFVDDFAAAVAATAATAVATAAATTVATAAATTVATTVATAMATTMFVAASVLVATTGVATRIATRITAGIAATVTAAFAGRCGFTAFGLLLTALRLALWLAAGIVAMVMTEESAKASAATTMAGFRLVFQTHENNGECRQTQGHAH